MLKPLGNIKDKHESDGKNGEGDVFGPCRPQRAVSVWTLLESYSTEQPGGARWYLGAEKVITSPII